MFVPTKVIANLTNSITMTSMDGVLIIDKPAGMTSHDVVARVRRILGERRIGHTGTLDPFATGVLVLLVGRATRLAQFLSGAEKEYEATIRLGYATDTGDLTGNPIKNASADNVQSITNLQSITREKIGAALAKLRGEIDQIPPMYSAKKVKGRKLYELARSGEDIERKPVRITIHEFELLPNDFLKRTGDGNADLNVRVVCSAGTYVRTLAEDLGKEFGLGAHLTVLKRTRAGDFNIERALSLDDLQDRVAGNNIQDSLVSPDAALSRLAFVHLSDAAAARARHGMQVRVDDSTSLNWRNGENVRMRGVDSGLLAVAVFEKSSATLHPKVVLVSDDL